ncbi:uncharacterized protein LOC115689302 [Syzygium oleosum]|uniref:uncharacterized protein LOC115689302 n=1 Tax=Syzygium oleosum TaxID=219896 RepID=UPI0011D29400|nr:uncharacterized protein LOC115689302 [Syzygium oleosum]
MVGNKRFVPPVKKNIGKSAYNHGNVCRFCGRRHGNGPCLSGIGACFGCGQHGHQVRNCPNRPIGPQVQLQQSRVGQQAGNGLPINQNRPQAQGRVYAVARKEVEDSLGMVTDTVSLQDHAVYALFDSGASHSFVSEQFIKLVGLKLKSWEVTLRVITPLKDEVLITVRCLGCKIVIGGKEEVIDLAVLAMYDFDVIIGMDWLVK